MKKKYSLKGKTCFQLVYRKGKKIRQKNCTFFVLKQCNSKNSIFCRKSEDTVKVGIVVPRYFGKAHVRNKAKRKFREAFRDYCSSDRYTYCMIVRLYNGFINMTIEEVKKEIADCFLKIESLH